jgi:hypothetical protein
MTEELGDDFEAEATVQQVGSECSPQRVRRDFAEVRAVSRARAHAPVGRSLRCAATGKDHPSFTEKTTAHPARSRGRPPVAPACTRESPQGLGRKTLLLSEISAYSLSARKHQDRPVTPEVAGSSPVAPVLDLQGFSEDPADRKCPDGLRFVTHHLLPPEKGLQITSLQPASRRSDHASGLSYKSIEAMTLIDIPVAKNRVTSCGGNPETRSTYETMSP